jgi:hypothetical protein
MLKIILILFVVIIIYKLNKKFNKPQLKTDFLTVICRVKNDHLLVESLIPHYLSQGVDKIYLIDDNSDYPYNIQDERVIIVKGKLARETKKEMADVSQLYKQIKNQTKWMINIDSDEFIYSRKNMTIRETLQTYFKDADCVYIPWVMFSYNGREHDGKHLINDYLHRWDHDKKHPHKNNDAKNRCRYDQIECKSIFKTNSFNCVENPHTPCDPIHDNLNYKESVYNTNHKSYKYKNLREKDIKNSILICNHYRFTSVDKIKQKCDKNVTKM